MLLRAAEEHDIDLSRSWMIGDNERDVEAGRKEEIARLKAHFGQFEHALAEGSPVGKRMDFLLQEINREITTYSNKLQGIVVSKVVVEAKSEVEKIREQVQNVE